MTTWLITGCSSGLGRAFAEAALERGYNVAASARDQTKVEDLAARYPRTALALSLTSPTASRSGGRTPERSKRLAR
jgi:short-subunit dehydrogenase